jgi:hypothetical protein
METTSPLTASVLDNKEQEQDDGSVLVPCGCGESDHLRTLWHDVDPDNAEGSELCVYVGCGSCGSSGPEIETDSENACPLGTAEREARMAWNMARRITAEAAGKVPEVKALVDHIQQQLALQQNAVWDYAELEALIKPFLPSSGTSVVANPGW